MIHRFKIVLIFILCLLSLSSCRSKQAEVSGPDQTPAPDSENTQLYILMYHHIVEGDGSDCNEWTITTSRLREDLQWLSDHGYTTVLPSELAQGGELPEKAVMLTFDDGYASNYLLAYPLLREYGAKAVISTIVKDFVERTSNHLTWEMCQEMVDSGLVEIGSHTYDLHTEGIGRLPDESQEDYEARVSSDLQKSIDLLQDELGAHVYFFAYPYGLVEPWADSFIQEHFSVTVTTQPGPADISGGLYNLPRYTITNDHKASEYLPS